MCTMLPQGSKSGRGRQESQAEMQAQKIRLIWYEQDLTHYRRLWRWRKGPWAKECGQPLEAGKGLEMDSPLEPPEGMQPCWHLDFSPVRPRPTFDLRNCEITNLYCFKALDFTLICYRQLNTIILVNSNYNNIHEHGVFPLCYALFSVLNMYWCI